MGSKINEIITGDYDYKGQAVVYGDTDSIFGDAIVRTNKGPRTIENLFLSGTVFWQHGDKEYSSNDSLKTMGYNKHTNQEELFSYNYVYRHKVSKKRFRITTTSGKTVDVTDDHSVMVLDNGVLVEKKPTQLTENDVIITI